MKAEKLPQIIFSELERDEGEGEKIGKRNVIESAKELTKEAIKERLIDIQAYTGFIEYTQAVNIGSLLSKGLYQSGSKRWGAQGRQTKGMMGTLNGVYLTAKGSRTSFDKWDSLPWNKTGPVAVLFDQEKLKNSPITFYQVLEGPEGVWDSEMSHDDLDQVAEIADLGGVDLTFHTDVGDTIPKETIIGLVVSPNESALERKRGDYVSDSGKLLKISSIQIREIIKNRLSRLILRNPEAQLVPLYDNKGNMLWPEEISYTEIQKLCVKRDR